MKSLISRQLSLVFADSPSGGGQSNGVSALTGRDSLLHTARTRKTSETNALKTASQSLEEVAELANLAGALLHVAANKGANGVDGQSVEEVVAMSHRILPRLSHQLLTGSYCPGDVRRVWIPKPGGGQRGLGIPNVIDRLVQQAVHQVLEPCFEAGFHESSHGFRKRRGARTAIAEASEYVEDGRSWVVAIDLSKFFDRVNHQRLLARLGQKVSDGRLLKLIHRMLTASVLLPNGTRVQTSEGTPQGGPLSPLLSNIVLDELDWEMDRRGLRFVRYADDFLVFVRSERAARRVMSALCDYIERRLRLKVNVEKSEVTRPEQAHFLGFSLVKRAEELPVEVLLSKRTQQRIRSKIREFTPRNWGQSLEACFAQINSYVKGWIGYFRLCTFAHARWQLKLVDAHLRRRIRAIIVVQKKKPQYLLRHLLERKVSKRTARNAAYAGGSWARSNAAGMHRAYPNAWFHARMESLWFLWRRFNSKPDRKALSDQLRLPGMR